MPIPRTLLKISIYCFTLAGRRFVLSEQDTETKQNPGPEGSSDETAEKEIDHLSDLSELEKIKLELQKEKEKATKELAEGEDEEEDLDDEGWIQEKELEEKISKKKRKNLKISLF